MNCRNFSQHPLQSVKNISIAGKRVLIRADFNVPLDKKQKIINDKHIKGALHTINYCIDNHAQSVIIVAHMGHLDLQDSKRHSLKPVHKRLEKLLEREIEFVEAFINDPQSLQNLQPGSVVLLENIRFYEGEKLNDEKFSKTLASLCDIYINDAFAASHRRHASTYGMTNYVKQRVAGFALIKELQGICQLMDHPTPPFSLVLGGAKIADKIPLLRMIIPKVDKLIIGGAISHTFLKAEGHDMQDSLCDPEYIEEAKKILSEARDKKVKVYLPIDVVVTQKVGAEQAVKVVTVQEIPKGFSAADIGPATIKLFSEAIDTSNTIIWNGPMGRYEDDLFLTGTHAIAEAISDSYAYSMLGGADTIKAVEKITTLTNYSVISSGGSATLALIEGKSLPGLEALELADA